MRSYNENLTAELAREGVEQLDTLKGMVRNMDMGEPLAEGDVIHMPKDYTGKLFQAPIRGTDAMAEYVMLEITRKGAKENETFRFYPNMLAKLVFPVDEKKQVRLPKVKTSGTASEEYCKHITMMDALNALKGKDIIVSKDTVYPTWRYGTKDVVNTHHYQYDIVK